MSSTVSLQVRGETLVLHPQRAVEWPARRTLIVADTHFGKSALFRQHGIAVPAGSDEYDRQTLSELVMRVGTQRLIVLGDFLHGPLVPASKDADALAAWCDALRPTQIHVVAGNHDRGARHSWMLPVEWHEGSWIEAPFRFTHDATGQSAEPPGAARQAENYLLSGHVHPVVRLQGLRKRAPRVPVFWQRAGGLVLPSFGVFTGGFVIKPSVGERVFAVGPQRVVPF